MGKKLITILFLLAVVTGLFYLFIKISTKSGSSNLNLLSPIQKATEQVKSRFGKTINVLLIGTDTSIARRNRGQRGFNTDSLILVSINTETKRVLLTSVPRDLWINGNKINALYTVYDDKTLIDAFEKITGHKIDGYIRVDFDQFEWIINAFGGVPATVLNTFTDNQFPNRNDNGAITVTFTQGDETMDGERALTFARSRKGNNGEGSDLMRAKRQHLILQAMVKGVSQPASQFWPMVISDFYNALINQGISTTLSLEDATYLWNFYKDRDKYTVESFVIGDKYIYYPGMYPQSEYRAWVFVPRDSTFEQLHKDIQAKLDGTYVEPTP